MHPEPIWNAHGLRFAKMMDLHVFERKSSEIANLMSPEPSPDTLPETDDLRCTDLILFP